MLQLLLKVDRALGDSHPLGHDRDDLRGLPFQDRTCGAPLGYVLVSRKELTFVFTPVPFFGQLLHFNYGRPHRCLTTRAPLPQQTRFAPRRRLLHCCRFHAPRILAIRRTTTGYLFWF